MIIPYVQTDKGTWSLSDEVMVGIFHEMAIHSLDRVVFANGTVTSPLEWMTFIKDKRNVVHIVGDGKDIEMIAWLNSFGHNYAFAHFCAFPCSWGKTSEDAGIESLSYWFNDLKAPGFEIDVMLGQVPATNVRAIEYVKKLGLIELGTVPLIKYKNGDNAIGAFFCYITREEF